MMRKNLKDRCEAQRNKAFCCKAPPRVESPKVIPGLATLKIKELQNLL